MASERPPDAFLSYTRFDDRRSDISAFRLHLSDAVREVTGEPFEIFQDVDDIEIGERWSHKLDQMLDEARFFIPIITPSYFRSKPCRDELDKFFRAEGDRGRQDLVLPIYYIESDVLEKDERRTADPLAKIIHERQRQDWRQLRFSSFNTKTVKTALYKLATEIARARRRAMPPKASPKRLDDEAPGRGAQQQGVPAQAQSGNATRKAKEEARASAQRGVHSPGDVASHQSMLMSGTTQRFAPDVFLSYAREDESRARQLAEMLGKEGYAVFWDRQIPPGETWHSYIGNALTTAKCVVVMWSPNSIESEFVIEEAQSGKNRRALIPVLIAKVQPPLGFGLIQAADLTDWETQGFSEALRYFLNSIRHKVDSLRTGQTESSDRALTQRLARTLAPAPDRWDDGEGAKYRAEDEAGKQAGEVEESQQAGAHEPIKIFISYSRKDEVFRERLQTHLSLLKREGVIDEWHDRQIGAGQDWAGAIDEHLNSAAVILLLVSPDFLASDYCYDLEMKRAVERHEAGDARVIPIILRPVDWYGAPFNKFQALPKDGRPVSLWADKDEAFANIARSIREFARLPEKPGGEMSSQPESEARTPGKSLAGGAALARTYDKIDIFISYSRKDEVFRERLQTHLSLLRREGVIDEWHDRRIGAGQEWAGSIDEHINTAAIILLLVSANFLASDYCYDLEMKRAVERHEAGDARVIPIILRSVDWSGAPFKKFQALPKDGRPVSLWADKDKAYTSIARGIRDAVEMIRAPAVGPQRTAAAPTPVEIFISYSHKDEALRQELDTHLKLLKRQGVIREWHDRRIDAEREYAGTVDEHVNTAAVILLLISADFVASDYCYDVEIRRALERHESGDARVIPVILRPVYWLATPFGKLQALPRGGKPVMSWSSRDSAFADVTRGIRETLR